MADRVDKHPFSKAQQHPDELKEHLASEIRRRLKQHPRIDEKLISVEVRGNTAVLTDRLDDRHARGRAEEIAAEVDGVNSVVNHIVVQREEPPGPTLTIRTPGTEKNNTTESS